MTRQQEVEQQCKRAAGYVPGKGWPQRSIGRADGLKYNIDYPQPVKIKMHHGEIVETGWENCMRAILQGVATLVEQ